MEKQPSKTGFYETWHSISDETVQGWMSEENLATRKTRVFKGFEIVDSLDGRLNRDVEISFVKLKEMGQYPQHVHNNSDAYFIIVNGRAVFLSGKERKEISKGEKIDVPRGTPHGFELLDGDSFEFISIQSPPIKDEHTGEEDFHLVDLV
jgi:mannose-6-phosphate isomerase-like protein (cupin superfamily)